MNLFKADFHEDGSCTVLGRVTGGVNATGSATGVTGEGWWMNRIDFTSITRTIFDRSDADSIVSGPTTLTVNDVILASPSTSTILWTIDGVGYNFIDQIAATNFPTGGHKYRIEYLFLSGAIKSWGGFEGIAQPNITS